MQKYDIKIFGLFLIRMIMKTLTKRWIYLHFHYSTSSLHRNQWMEKLDSLYKNNGLGERYEKNNPNIYYLLNSIDGVNTAIKNAKRRMSDFGINIKRPSEYDPGTTMHILVEELKRYLDE